MLATEQQPSAMPRQQTAPLVVDLDGTLTPTDTLIESIVQLLTHSPLNLLRLPLWLLRGRAAFKHEIARRSIFSASQLPYREELLDYLRSERVKGRSVILATAAHRSIADAVAKHLECFDAVLGSDADRNLKGVAKLDAIRASIGADFVYAGDSSADLPIWQAAHAAILVGVAPALADKVRHAVPIEKEYPLENVKLRDWLRVLRVHQWLKNLLLFVPLLTAFSFMDLGRLWTMGLAFHPRKRLRPFANARIPVLQGVAMAALALCAGLVLACGISIYFFLILLSYLCLTSAYSLAFRKCALIDVIVLSLLYTLRILAGSVAIGVATSSWLLAFSIFLFFSLALVKRCAELVSLDPGWNGTAPGRDYRAADLVVLWPLGIASSLSALVVFGLFINAADTQARYGTPALLWLVAIALIYWLGRIWIHTARGTMHDDPVVFAIKDRASQITVLFMVLAMLAGHFLVWDASWHELPQWIRWR